MRALLFCYIFHDVWLGQPGQSGQPDRLPDSRRWTQAEDRIGSAVPGWGGATRWLIVCTLGVLVSMSAVWLLV